MTSRYSNGFGLKDEKQNGKQVTAVNNDDIVQMSIMTAMKSLEKDPTEKNRPCFCYPPCPLDNVRTTPSAGASASTSKLSKPSSIVSKTTPAVVPPPLYPDWSPLDDGIAVTPSNSTAKPPTRAAVDDYIDNVLYNGPSGRRNRLPVFRETCPDE